MTAPASEWEDARRRVEGVGGLALSLACFRCGDLAGAVAALPGVKQVLGEIEKSLEVPPVSDLGQSGRLAEAWRSYQQGQWIESACAWREAAGELGDAHPEAARALLNEALVHLQLDELTKARQTLEALVRTFPESIDARWLLVVCAVRQRNRKQARREVEDLLRLDPLHERSHLLAATLRARAHDFPGALDLLRDRVTAGQQAAFALAVHVALRLRDRRFIEGLYARLAAELAAGDLPADEADPPVPDPRAYEPKRRAKEVPAVERVAPRSWAEAVEVVEMTTSTLREGGELFVARTEGRPLFLLIDGGQGAARRREVFHLLAPHWAELRDLDPRPLLARLGEIVEGVPNAAAVVPGANEWLTAESGTVRVLAEDGAVRLVADAAGAVVVVRWPGEYP